MKFEVANIDFMQQDIIENFKFTYNTYNNNLAICVDIFKIRKFIFKYQDVYNIFFFK